MKRIKALGRALLLAFVRALYPAAPQPAPAIDRAAIRKVLVIRTDTRVGNVLLTTPLLRALRRGLPGARIDWLVADGKQGLVEGLADRLVPFRKKDLFQAPWRFFRLLRDLRRERYDVVIEAGHWHAFSFTSLWMARRTGAPIRVGHARGLSDRFLTHGLPKDPTVIREVPGKLELLRPLGIEAADEHLETTVDRAPEVAAAGRGIVALGGGAPVVAFNPGARKADHRWSAEAFGDLARRLRDELGVAPLVLWGPGEEEIAQAVVAASQGRALLAPRTGLRELAAVFRHSTVVVTNDTGPMHLAVATGVPVVATLLADDGARWSHAGRFTGVPVRTGTPEEVGRVFGAVADFLREPERAHS